jgi:adenylate cyclase
MEPDAAGKVIGEKRFLGRISRRTAVASIIFFIVVAGGLAGWNYYLRQSKWVEPASLSRMAFLLPDKPSIAVLPFINMSEDPKQEYFSDGITEEVITALSKVPELFVIARNSTFTYKGKPVKVQHVAEELGVQYVLEGSVRKAGDKVRITAQLVDAITGNHLWAERYDRELKEIFTLQDEITKKILAALQVKLTIGEQARTMAKGTNDLEAYLKILHGRALQVDFKIENVTLMRQLAEEAISLDPKYSNAYELLGKSYIQEVWWGLTKTPERSLERAFEFYQKALALDENNAGAHSSLANIYNLKRQFEKAIIEIELAISLNPNDADIHANFGRFLHNLGRTKESVAAYKKAMRLNPHAPSWYLYNFGVTYWMMGQHEKAIALCKKAIERNPDQMFAYMALAATYSELGRAEEASASAAEALRIKPKLNLEWFEKMLPWKNKADVDRIVDALRKAGIPDKPPQ